MSLQPAEPSHEPPPGAAITGAALAGTAECARCTSPIAAEDLRCAVCGLPTPVPANANDPHAPSATKVELLRCEGCGAAVSYDVEAQAPKCSFCGSVMHVEVPDDPIEEAEAALPFAIDAAAAQAGLKAWLGGLGFFRPGDLQSTATIGDLRPLWWVGWVFDAEALVSWAADSEVGSRRARWAPHAGQREAVFRKILVPASRGLSEPECVAIHGGYRLSTTGPLPSPEPGVLVERFDAQRSAARAMIARALERAALADASTWVPGTRQRKLSVAVLPRRLVSRRLIFPAYVLAYRYRGKLYRAVVNGQNAGFVHGRAPYSIARITAACLAAVGFLALVIAMIASA